MEAVYAGSRGVGGGRSCSSQGDRVAVGVLDALTVAVTGSGGDTEIAKVAAEL